MLQRIHPCSRTCGKKRQAGLFVDQALDRRCCGGMIIQPSRHSGRAANRPKKTYKGMDEEEIVGYEADDEGNLKQKKRKRRVGWWLG